MKKLIFFLMATILTTGVVRAQKPTVITKDKAGWHKIGDARVNFKTDKDKFILIGKDKYKSLRIKAKDAPIHIEKMLVEYEGDVQEEVSLGSHLKTGAESRIIELKHGKTDIKNVSFIYHTISDADKKAELELWGVK